MVVAGLLFSGLAQAAVQNDSGPKLPAEWLLPSWLEASDVVQPGERIDWNRVSPRAREVWSGKLGGANCVVDSSWLEAGRGPSFPLQSLNELAEEALFIVTGTVESKTSGFFFGDPATELRIGVEKVEKGAALPREIRVVYPAALIETAAGTLCRTSPGFETQPEAGDPVVLWIREGSPSEESGVFLFSYPDWAWETQGKLVLPFASGRRSPLDAPQSLEELVRRLSRDRGVERR